MLVRLEHRHARWVKVFGAVIIFLLLMVIVIVIGGDRGTGAHLPSG